MANISRSHSNKKDATAPEKLFLLSICKTWKYERAKINTINTGPKTDKPFAVCSGEPAFDRYFSQISYKETITS
jgi:hypothetical protein